MGDEPKRPMKPVPAEQAVFAGALQFAAHADRAAYLDRACGTDAALRRRVEALLRAAENAGDFLEQPPDGLPSAELKEQAGDRIGRYKLLEKIGEGGCGIVYMAEQEEPVRRRVALKVIKLGMDTRAVIARFEAERQALALMDHANIAKVFDGGATRTGRPYFVMELVRGVRITEFCDEARLPTGARLRLFVQVCQAIQHAHQKGIIHRDLKPSNILVTVNDGVPVPKVIDFGIAKATGARLTDKTLFTQFHSFIGTPAYTSPEQAEMSSVDVDTRSDIYSLGVLLYELLTGQTPFDGEQLLSAGLDEMRRIIRDEEPLKPSARLTRESERMRIGKRPLPAMQERGGGEKTESNRVFSPRSPPPNELISALRGDLDWIVMKCLEKDRARRYETANGIAADIRRHLNHEPVMARPPSRAYVLRKLARRHRGALTVHSGVLAVLLLAVLALAASNARVRRERNQKDAALQQRGAALEAAKGSEQRAHDQLFESLKNQALARRHSGQMGQRLQSLAVVTDARRLRRDADLRDHALAAMALPDIELGPSISGPNAALMDVAFDGAYQLAARIDRDGTLVVSRLFTGEELRRLPAQATPGNLIDFSPDGKHLVHAAENGAVQLWEWRSGRSVLTVGRGKRRAVAFSPDSRLLVVAEDRGVVCFTVADGARQCRWETVGRPHALTFHPDNRQVAVGFVNAEVVSIYDVTTAQVVTDLPIGRSERVTLAWHPAGRLLATAGSDPRIQIWDVAARRRASILEGHAQQVTLLRFHPGGEILVSFSWDNVLRLWHPVPGRLLMQLPALAWRGFSTDGRWAGVLKAADGVTRLWGVLPSPEHHTFIKTTDAKGSAPYEGSLTPDGALLAIGAADGVRLWDVQRGEELQWLELPETRATWFRHDGHEMLTCSWTKGLQRWAIKRDPRSGLTVGPPLRVALPFAPERMALSADQRLLVVVGEEAGDGQIIDLETGKILIPRLAHSRVAYVALSQDSQWVATSGWHSGRVRLWSARTGEVVQKWDLGIGSKVFFTPDSRELIIARSEEFIFHDTQTLDVTRRLPRAPGLYPGHVAFTADGTLMAMELTPGIIELKAVATAQTVARLENPRGDISTWMAFTPDSQLVVAAQYANLISRWDLPACRVRLKAMNLDWDWPEFPGRSADPAQPRATPAPGADSSNRP